MKNYMPLDGLRCSRDSGSAHCDTPKSAVLGRPGGGCRALPIILLALCYFSFYKLIFNNVTRCRNDGVRFVVSLVTE